MKPHWEAALDQLQNRRRDVEPIGSSELASRIVAAQQLMQAGDVDALVLTASASLRYFTGVDWHMLERMTGGRYRSTPHRVRHAVARDGVGDEVRDRLSFPFFFDPSWDAEVRPVPVVDIAGRELDDGAQRWDGRSVHQDDHHTYGEHLLAKVSKVFPHLAATEP